MIVALSVPSLAAVSLRGGLAGGAFRISAVMDRPIRDNISLAGELGYALGNGYTLATGGIDLQTTIKNDFYLGAEVSYSSYSSAVRLGLPAVDITDRSGVGVGVFAGMTRDKMFGQVGYDTRLGAVAEAGYIIRM